ncbi:MAG: luciferase-like protein [Pseudonocardiales bacterium]|nr:luciferase-like protein [Pseudonocardiales bacterium]
MDLGFAIPISGSWATPENVATIARAADERGYRGLWTFQRVLYPTTSELAPVYRSVLDPIVLLGFAAAVTTRVRLGLAIVNGPYYAPAILAKQFAALDVLSNGRLDAGVGLGWSADEYAAAGVPMRGRRRRYEEWLDCLDALLTQDPVSFDGEFYTVPRSHVGPMPVQRPRPPLLLGGTAEPALRRAGARGDGWISSSRVGLDDVRAAVVVVRTAAEEAGKPRDAVRCVVRGVTALREAAVDGADRAPLHGSLDQIRTDLDLFADAGVDEVFLDLNFDSERVGNPDADPAAAMDMAQSVLDACAPG